MHTLRGLFRFIPTALAVCVLTALTVGGGVAYAQDSSPLRVFACEPEWGTLASEIGGPYVSVFSATTGKQDPHMVQARPGLISRMRNADLVFCTGIELEIGWLPLLLINASNARVQPGAPGYLLAGEHVRLLDVNPNADPSQGDAHAVGNHHVVTDPRNIGILARVLAERLAQIDPVHAAEYETRQRDFAQRWSEALSRWQAQAAPLRGVPVLVFHRSWSYLFDWLGLKDVGTLEPKPGLPPSAAHLNAVLARLRIQPARMVIYAAFEDPRPAAFISAQAGIPEIELPYTVGGSARATDLFALYGETVERLLGGLAGKSVAVSGE